MTEQMDKLEIIMKTAKMLADENRGTWSGDVHESNREADPARVEQSARSRTGVEESNSDVGTFFS